MGFFGKNFVRMGFATDFIRLIMMYITIVSYKVLTNRAPSNSIQTTCELRQGCPLSPYLFIICAKDLSTMSQQAKMQALVKGVSVCNNAPRVSHLCFANDSILYCQASVLANVHIQNILAIYGATLGQHLNREETKLLFSCNTNEDVMNDIKELWGVHSIHHHDKYLGLPSFVDRSKFHTFWYIKDKVWAKRRGWKEKLLSQVGRKVLTKAIIQAILTYVMSCFKIPKGVCR